MFGDRISSKRCLHVHFGKGSFDLSESADFFEDILPFENHPTNAGIL